jgi:transposase InsO family protein
MGVSRSGFHAWLNRSPSARSRRDETVGQQVKASFLASDRTYGARRVWRDLLADGVECGLHRIERLMRLQALRARPRRRRLPGDKGPPTPWRRGGGAGGDQLVDADRGTDDAAAGKTELLVVAGHGQEGGQVGRGVVEVADPLRCWRGSRRI